MCPVTKCALTRRAREKRGHGSAPEYYRERERSDLPLQSMRGSSRAARSLRGWRLAAWDHHRH